MKSHHFVASYKTKVAFNHRLTLEAYYQHLYDVPVEQGTSFSVLNLEELDDIRVLVNEGTGRNYGLDMGFERFTDKGLYYLVNGSFMRSFYTDAQGIERSTENDFGYNVKFLMGREYRIGEKKDRYNLFSWNTTLSAIGGRPYTPLDLEASALFNTTILDEERAFAEREDGLIVLDFTVMWQINKKKRSGTWAIQLKNLFSSADAVYREYDEILGEEVIVPSSSFFPVISYGLEF